MPKEELEKCGCMNNKGFCNHLYRCFVGDIHGTVTRIRFYKIVRNGGFKISVQPNVPNVNLIGPFPVEKGPRFCQNIIFGLCSFKIVQVRKT